MQLDDGRGRAAREEGRAGRGEVRRQLEVGQRVGSRDRNRRGCNVNRYRRRMVSLDAKLTVMLLAGLGEGVLDRVRGERPLRTKERQHEHRRYRSHRAGAAWSW